MKFRFFFIIFFIGLVSCSEQQARRPISATKSHLVESTTALLKKINTIEEIKIKIYNNKMLIKKFLFILES